MLHGGLVSNGRLVRGLRGQNGGDAVHRRLLDSAVRDIGTTRVRSVPGKCTAHEESAWTQERRAGEPMAVKTSPPRPAQQLVPTHGGNPSGADILAAAGSACAGCLDLHPAHAKGVDSDECAISECDQRSEWNDRPSHRARGP